LTSPFEKTPITILTKPTVQPGNAFEDTAFKPGFEIVKFQTTLWSLWSSLLLWKRYHQKLSETELDHLSAFLSFIFHK
jgi:hypothetical protein